MNMHLKNERQECKTGPVRVWELVGGESVNEEGKRGQI
jgi:hypothetical protein